MLVSTHNTWACQEPGASLTRMKPCLRNNHQQSFYTLHPFTSKSQLICGLAEAFLPLQITKCICNKLACQAVIPRDHVSNKVPRRRQQKNARCVDVNRSTTPLIPKLHCRAAQAAKATRQSRRGTFTTSSHWCISVSQTTYGPKV